MAKPKAKKTKRREKKNVPHEVKIYPGTGHGFDGEIWEDARVRSLAFLQKYLVNGATAR